MKMVFDLLLSKIETACSLVALGVVVFSSFQAGVTLLM